MEHLFHLLGGGCGEHLALPLLGSVVMGFGLLRLTLKDRWQRLRAWVRPAQFTHAGKLYVDGRDYHGENDRRLIEEHGEQGLNFCPSTPPEYR